MWNDKYKQTLSVYGIKGKEKTPSTSQNKEEVSDGYVHMYECGKQLLHSTYEWACTAHITTISIIKVTVDIYSSEIK